jgi:hypothetical protein
MAVQPAFLADGARPSVFAFLADLWARSTPSKAGFSLSSKLSSSASYSGSERPCSAFWASPPQQVRRRRRRPLATHLEVRYGEDGACPLVSNVPLLKRQQMARNRAQVHNINISRCAMATTYHIAPCDGEDNNNTAVTTSYFVNKQPLVRMRTSFILQKQCA